MSLFKEAPEGTSMSRTVLLALASVAVLRGVAVAQGLPTVKLSDWDDRKH
jgi:hypothetical protein